MRNIDAPGLLSKKQREYLLGEYEPANEATMRQRIRERVRGGFQDFSLLYATQTEHDIGMTFGKSEREEFFQELEERREETGLAGYHPDMEPDRSLKDQTLPGMKDAIAYFYCALNTRGFESEEENFAEIVRNGVKQAVEDIEAEDVIADVEVEIDKNLREERLGELRERALSGEELSSAQMKALIDTDPTIVTDLFTQGLEDGE